MPKSQYRFLIPNTQNEVLIVRLKVTELRGDELVAEVKNELIAVTDDYGAKQVILDLRSVIEISSRGVGGLAEFYTFFVKTRCGRIALCNLNSHAAGVLSTMRFASSNGSASLANIPTAGAAVDPDAPKPRVLFEHVALDIPAAIAALCDSA